MYLLSLQFNFEIYKLDIKHLNANNEFKNTSLYTQFINFLNFIC